MSNHVGMFPPINPWVPTPDVPETDDEARAALRSLATGRHAECLVGLFNIERKLGKSLLEAYKITLLNNLPDAELARVADVNPDAAAVLAERR